MKDWLRLDYELSHVLYCGVDVFMPRRFQFMLQDWEVITCTQILIFLAPIQCLSFKTSLTVSAPRNSQLLYPSVSAPQFNTKCTPICIGCFFLIYVILCPYQPLPHLSLSFLEACLSQATNYVGLYHLSKAEVRRSLRALH